MFRFICTWFVVLGLWSPDRPAFAQTAVVEGTVRDQARQPLPGVNVVLRDAAEADPAGPVRGAATNFDGRYRIEEVPAGTYRLIASAIGYRPEEREVVLQAGEVVTLDLRLEEVTLETGEVVVTASRRAQATEQAPASLSVIPARDLEVRNTTSLDDALRYVPGVQLTEDQVSIRGSSGFSYNTGSRVLLLLDGIPFLSPDRDAIPLDALPMAQVARIEVLKGPGSALYGGGALGGVINVITRDAPEVPETKLRLFGGAYEPIHYDAWREGWDEADEPRPFGGVVLSHAQRLGEGLGGWVNVSLRRDQGYTDVSEEREFDAYAKLSWRPRPVTRFDLLGGWSRRTNDTFFYWNGLEDPLSPGEFAFGGVEFTGASDGRTDQFSLLPSFSHVIGTRWSYALRGRLFGAIIRPVDDEGEVGSLDDGTIGFRYGGEAQINWNPDENRYFTAGLSGDALLTESSFFGSGEAEDEVRSQPEGALFAQWEQRLLRTFDVTAGLRYDAYRIDSVTTEARLSPKLSLTWAASDVLSLRAAFGQGFRVPGLAERFVDNSSFLPLISNLDLRPETSTGYEVGARTTARLGPARVSLDVAAFWNEYEDLVEPVFDDSAAAFQFVNLTRARIRGAEAVFDANAARDRLRVQVSYTFLDADDRTEDRPLTFRSRHLLQTSATVRPLPWLDLGADYRFASAFERIDTDFTLFVPDAAVINPTHVVDARVGVEWSAFRIALLAENVLDYYYVERPAILAPPRRFLLQLQATL